MRELVLDTETTGLDPKDGHRVIELACVELINYIPTGAYWHWYFNPERDVPKARSRARRGSSGTPGSCPRPRPMCTA